MTVAFLRPGSFVYIVFKFFICLCCIAMTYYEPHTAGVPLRCMVAGVAMGLILEPDGSFAVLTDILGSEDALGDMDFKVAGNDQGITAFQMDIKVEGITLEIMKEALEAANKGRRHILQTMDACSPPPRRALAPHAPRIRSIMVPVDKLGMVIGSGGRTVRSIEDSTGVELQIEQTGEVWLKGPSDQALEEAVKAIEVLVYDPEPGRIYRQAKVVQVAPFGAFVELTPKRDGLLHVSEWGVERTPSITEVVKEGDLVDVMVLEVAEGTGKIRLSRKAVLLLDGGEVSEVASTGDVLATISDSTGATEAVVVATKKKGDESTKKRSSGGNKVK